MKMRECWLKFGCVETRWACLLIGLQQTLWALEVFLSPDGRLSRILSLEGLDETWFSALFINGILLVIGSIAPWRSGRQIGLFLSGVAWLITFWLFIRVGVTTLNVLTAPLIGAYCFLLLVNDSRKKGNHGAIS